MASELVCPGLTIGNYEVQRKLDSGAFATVWLGEHRLTHVRVALKAVDNASLTTSDLQARFVREMAIAKQLDHPFIAHVFEVIRTDDQTFIVQELAERGSILDFINARDRVPEVQARRLFGQLVCVLDYLHNEKRVVHRDLKAENVLLDRHMNIRVIDFGLSNTFTADNGLLHTSCGSPHYAAPEMIKGEPYTKAVDIWSAGVLLYAMVTGGLPFSSDTLNRLLTRIAIAEPYIPAFLSPALRDLLVKLLQKRPKERLSIQRIREHPWLAQTGRSIAGDCWRVHAVDPQAVYRVGQFGVDTKTLTAALLHGEFDEETAMYYMIRKNEITDRIGQTAAANRQSLCPQQRKRVHTTLASVAAATIVRAVEQPRLLVSLPSPALEVVEEHQ
jgi:tRNA A-37 threonylcarbamoyl transferase component Bud32